MNAKQSPLDTEPLAAPFPYFGGKRKAAKLVWSLFGEVDNYVEPFAGSAAMLLAAPEKAERIETLNDADGFIVNFWRAVQQDPDGVTYFADYPVSELDLFARHGWLVNRKERLIWALEDPDYYDVKIAGWWVWGACAWIGSGWCEGKGPWVSDGAHIRDTRQLPHLGNAGRGINRKLPHLGDAGRGINRKLPHLGDAPEADESPRTAFIRSWMRRLAIRLSATRVTCGDWLRVTTDSVTTRHGTTAVFLDPPYTKGNMDYAVGGVGGDLAAQVRLWCLDNGSNPDLRIVLCGHDGEHDDLEAIGWSKHYWKAGGGYAKTKEAVANRKSEAVWASPACVKPAVAAPGEFTLEAYSCAA